MRALITGITGFVGSHLAEYLLSEGVEVWGATSPCEHPDKSNFVASGLHMKVLTCCGFNIEDARDVGEIIHDSDFDYIFHLAGQRRPDKMMQVNIIGTKNLLEEVRKEGTHPVIVIAGCGEEYGCPERQIMRNDGFIRDRPVTDEEIDSGELKGLGFAQLGVDAKLIFKPVDETTPLQPISLYGVSKAAADMLGYAYHKEYGMKIVRTRAFDITGPRDASSAASNITMQIVSIEREHREPVVKVGSLEVEKDFTDVRDVVKAYWLAARRCKYGEAYNICSNRKRSIQSVIDALRMQSTAQFDVVEDKSQMHPGDIPVIQGDYSKFNKQTGWKPKIGFAKTMGDLLDYWRKKI